MKPRHSLRILLAVLSCATINACSSAPMNSRNSTMNSENSTISQSAKSTFCMGRFVIDMPAGATLSGGNYKYDFMRLEKPMAMSRDVFEKEIEERERKLKAVKHEKDANLLRKMVRLESNSYILAFWKESYSEFQMQIDGYRWTDGTRFLIRDQVDNDKQDIGITAMRDALTRLRPRANTDIPTEPGFCFEGGFIANPRWRNEEAGVDIDVPGHPDAFFSIWIYPLASHKRAEPLLDRVGGVLQQIGNLATSVRVLRKGDRQIGPYKGQEYLVAAPNSGGMRAHSFIWETQGEGTLDMPSIKIEFESGHRDSKGNPQQTSLTDEQALKLWDEVISSFRLRPTGEPEKTSAVTPPKLPLGERVLTGAACPQTGWWQCVEIERVQGGRRKHFTVGEPMPPVVLVGDPTLWQRVKGERPTHEMTTVWKLVDYDEEPKPAEVATTPPEEVSPLAQEGNTDAVPPQADDSGNETPPGTA